MNHRLDKMITIRLRIQQNDDIDHLSNILCPFAKYRSSGQFVLRNKSLKVET